MTKPYVLLEEVISQGECAALLDFFESNEQPDPRPGWGFCPISNMHSYLDGKIELDRVEPEVLPLLRVIDVARDHFLSTYTMHNVFEYKRGFMGSMRDGARLQEHSDDDDLYSGRRKNEKHYSGLLFLTDSYEGGELLFPEFGDKLKPPARSLVLFRGSHHHGVNPVLSGTRVNYVLFFKDYDPNEDVLIQEFDPKTYDTKNGPGTS
jgi:hypothetical protein